MNRSSQDFNRFQFIELSAEPEPFSAQKRSQEGFPGAIPADQFLHYLDLVSMPPDPPAHKAVPIKLQQKYRLIPFALKAAHHPLRCPSHLDAQFHLEWPAPEAAQKLYIALCIQPRANHVLRLIHNATGLYIYAFPFREESYARFINEHAQRLDYK
jgi:hypothetical protein